MSTVLDTLTTAVKDVAALPARMLARSRYRESVFSGTMPDEATLTAARRIPIEWRADRQTYESREQAVKALREDVPNLATAAERAAADLATARGFLASPLADTMTVAELRQRLAGLTKLPTGTPWELARALQDALADGPGRGGIGRLKGRVLDTRAAAATAKSRAERMLLETAAAPPADNTRAIQRLEALRRNIAEREQIIQAEATAAEVQRQCEKAAKNELAPSAVGLPPSTPAGAVYRFLRGRLDRLLDMAGGKAAAEKQNAADQAEIADLQARLAQAQQARLASVMDPKAMRWLD